ncbi:hypothetical protein TWF694_002044 [Orbilia ellipsospora]|uniref:Uncharacterized protein n=1 Tax=Orbilia ellipsospora TaxID=2528407 RepID=A0AAV9X797_9PEZI
MSSVSLNGITSRQLVSLRRELWDWSICDDCENKRDCSTPTCAIQLQTQLSCYFKYCHRLVNSYRQHDRNGDRPALSTFEDLLALIRALKENPALKRIELTNKVFKDAHGGTGGATISTVELERALNLAAKIVTMTSCTSLGQSLLLLEHGLIRIPWRADSSLCEFITRTFPSSDSQNPSAEMIVSSIEHSILARKLKKVAGLRLIPTDDLSSHLKMSRQHRTLQIFHHCGFLKENLRKTEDLGSLSVEECLKLGCIPRQLALETLYTIQRILFPLHEAKSYSLLSSLISSASFDPECLEIPSVLHRGPEEGEFRYYYFGSRLEELYEEVSEPGPQNRLGKWIDKRKGTRHVMLATLTGVVIAIVLGILTLGVSGYQAWIGYQQWQHPKSTSDN